MTSLPVQSGPSQTLSSVITWLGRAGAGFFSNSEGDQSEWTHEARDQVASLLHFYALLESNHDQWAGQLPDREPDTAARDTADKYAHAFRDWHGAALALLKIAGPLVACGHDIPGVRELQDRAGFCPYIGVSIDSSILGARDSMKVVSREEVRDGGERSLVVTGFSIQSIKS